MRTNIYQVISAIATFTPSLTGVYLTLTALIANIKRSLISSITVQSAVTGVNGVYATSGTITPVIGTTYYLVVETTENISGRKTNHVFQYTATTTTYTDLVDAFVTAVTARTGAPFTAAKVSSHLRLTEAPTRSRSTALAGEVKITAKINNASGLFAAVDTVVTAHVYPVGQPAQFTAATESGAFRVSGSVSSSAVYTVVTVFHEDGNGNPTKSVLWIDESLTGLTYITSAIKQFIAQLGLGEGTAVTVTASATSPDTAASIPLGAREATVSSANAGYFIGLPSDAPVGTELTATTGATTAKVQLPAGESLNGGTAAGSVALTASKLIKFRKTSATTWLAHAFALDGTASDSTAEDQAASA